MGLLTWYYHMLFKDLLHLVHFQDGVLIRGKNALPAAKEALSILDGNNKFGLYLRLYCSMLCS
jgi:hypothetical protein